MFDVSGGTDGGRDGTDLVPTRVLTRGVLPGSALAPWGCASRKEEHNTG